MMAGDAQDWTVKLRELPDPNLHQFRIPNLYPRIPFQYSNDEQR